ncbi:MAG: anaerobic ribonucleoside-triphosphate reductase activating protein [Planctomycetota bacterium]|nr:MAG: anaerobic ribonucleoside-triphosphate reductase activating protein [Planctomycetota bacterium]
MSAASFAAAAKTVSIAMPVVMPAIAGIQPLSLQDFPGTPAAILFTRGCNLRCSYCHNPQLLGPGVDLPAAQVWEFLCRRQGRLKGIVITGGEPTLQAGLIEFLTALRQLGYLIKLDSNGMRPEVIDAAVNAGLVDHVSLDWKVAPGDEDWCGLPTDACQRLQQCAAAVRRAGVTLEWRTTVLEPLHNAEKLTAIAAHFQSGDQWSLQSFRCQGELLDSSVEMAAPAHELLNIIVRAHSHLCCAIK